VCDSYTCSWSEHSHYLVLTLAEKKICFSRFLSKSSFPDSSEDDPERLILRQFFTAIERKLFRNISAHWDEFLDAHVQTKSKEIV
jgi:hypothetical protein